MNRELIVKRIKNKMETLDNWRIANTNSSQDEYSSKRKEYLELSAQLQNILTQQINN